MERAHLKSFVILFFTYSAIVSGDKEDTTYDYISLTLDGKSLQVSLTDIVDALSRKSVHLTSVCQRVHQVGTNETESQRRVLIDKAKKDKEEDELQESESEEYINPVANLGLEKSSGKYNKPKEVFLDVSPQENEGPSLAPLTGSEIVVEDFDDTGRSRTGFPKTEEIMSKEEEDSDYKRSFEESIKNLLDDKDDLSERRKNLKTPCSKKGSQCNAPAPSNLTSYATLDSLDLPKNLTSESGVKVKDAEQPKIAPTRVKIKIKSPHLKKIERQEGTEKNEEEDNVDSRKQDAQNVNLTANINIRSHTDPDIPEADIFPPEEQETLTEKSNMTEKSEEEKDHATASHIFLFIGICGVLLLAFVVVISFRSRPTPYRSCRGVKEAELAFQMPDKPFRV